MIVSPWCTRRAAAPLTFISPDPRDAGDRVGLKARAVVDVHDVDLLVLEDVGGLQQVGVDRDRADVVQVAIGDGRPVDLRLEHHALHVVIAFLCRLGSRCVGTAGRLEDHVVDQAGGADVWRRPRAARVGRATPRRSSVSGSTSARGTPDGLARAASSLMAGLQQPRRASARRARRSPRRRRSARIQSQRAARARAGRAARCGWTSPGRRARARSGRPRSRTGRLRSRTSRRMTTTCWASFWPK